MIEVDGGENATTAGQAAAAGANAIVAGSAIFGTRDYAEGHRRHPRGRNCRGGKVMNAPNSIPDPERDALKRAAADAAVQLVEQDMIVGLGTGSTAAFAVEALGAAPPARAAFRRHSNVRAHRGAGDGCGYSAHVVQRAPADRSHDRRRR